MNLIFDYTPKIKLEDSFYEMVKDFHRIFGHPVAETPISMPLDLAINRTKFTVEEVLVEFLHQSSTNEEEFLQAMEKVKEGIEEAIQKSLKVPYPKTELERIVGQSDALVDGSYFINGSHVAMGVRPMPLVQIVQNANMAKLDENKKPIFREKDNKIMKPEGWVPPETFLEAEIVKQIEESKK